MENEILTLLERVKQDDEGAFAELCERYKTLTEAAVHRFAPSFSVDGGEGEYGIDDLRQYAAVALYRAAKTYKPDDDGKGKAVSFGLYAKICVNNALISVFRKYRSLMKKNGRQASEKEKIAGEKSSQSKSRDPLEMIVSDESANELAKKIKETLSRYETEIFDCYLSGKPVGEIAHGLCRDEKSVSNALYRVKNKIKRLLK